MFRIIAVQLLGDVKGARISRFRGSAAGGDSRTLLGFDGVDAGGLDESWRQQPGRPVYTKDFDVAGVTHALSQATKERKAEWRATAKSPGTFAEPA